MRPRSQESFPLSLAQQRLWLLERLEPGHAAYNMRSAHRVTGPLDAELLERCIDEITARHQTLRTNVVTVDGRPVQRVHDTRRHELRIEDLCSVPADERELELGRRMAHEVRQLFDLAEGPLLRVTLFRLAREEHVLLLVLHHIVSDGWSMGVFVGELLALYEAFRQGRPSPLDPLPIQYTEFARRQREEVAAGSLDRQLAYWKKQLELAPRSLELPADRPRPAAQTFHGAARSLRLPPPVAEALERFASAERATPFMVLLAALSAVLQRYTDQRELVIGSPIANRNRAEIEGLIGFFVNTLALRMDLAGDPTFRELLDRVRETALEAYDHQDLPFEKLVEELKPERDMSRTPVFQVMLIVLNTPTRDVERAGLTLRHTDVEVGTARFDVTLFARREADGWILMADYNADLFDPPTIDRLLGHLRRLLEDAIERPAARLSELSLLTVAEERTLLDEWNRTAADYPAQACIQDLFEAQAERTPEAVAVFDRDVSWSFGELNAGANRLAHHLRKLGLERDEIVAVQMERSPRSVMALLAVLKSGAAFLPVDPHYPEERIAFLLQDAGPRVLLSEGEPTERIAALVPVTVRLDTVGERLATEPDRNPERSSRPDDVAYVTYTSGSTGKPKGVQGLHRGAVNRFAWMWKAYPFRPGEVCCHKTSISFVDSVWEIFGPLLRGIPVAVVAEEEVRDPHRMLELLAEHRVTRIVVVPSLLRTLLDLTGDLAGRVPDLRFWISSGETLPAELSRRFHRKFPGATLINLYGSSEVSADVTARETSASDGPASVIGRPIANSSVFILDRHLRPVPVGVPGEIYVGGVGLARGYLERPELTAETFLPHPFSDDPDSRLYRTGDLGRYRADGAIEFLGRADHQLKIRGFRVEPGEIETALVAHAGVREVVVAARQERPGDQRLVAWVAGERSRRPSAEELRVVLRQELPEYMIPSAFVFLDELPKTPNGKVDRLRLPGPDRIRPKRGDRDAPRTTMELLVAELWREVLSVERARVSDNFYDLGGHSLLAVEFLEKLHGKTGLRIQPRELLLQTLGQLAAGCEKKRAAGG